MTDKNGEEVEYSVSLGIDVSLRIIHRALYVDGDLVKALEEIKTLPMAQNLYENDQLIMRNKLIRDFYEGVEKELPLARNNIDKLDSYRAVENIPNTPFSEHFLFKDRNDSSFKISDITSTSKDEGKVSIVINKTHGIYYGPGNSKIRDKDLDHLRHILIHRKTPEYYALVRQYPEMIKGSDRGG